MAPQSKTALLSKIYKVPKKHYKPVRPNLDRPVLEQLLFACCLENAHHQAAEEAFDSLQATFFDWNEVRVSTLTELSEAMHVLPDPQAAAARLKRVLQNTFETYYAFDIESLRKQNLGPAQARLKKIDGTTPFVVNYVIQTCLGGHAIPIDSAAFELLEIMGAATPADVKAGHVPGMERAIAKTKGLEFASLLHQFAADFASHRYSPDVHKIILEIAPEAKDRLPKRTRKKAATPTEDKEPHGKRTRKGTAKTPARGKTRRTAGAAPTRAASKKPTRKTTKKAAKKKTAARKLTKRKPR